MFDKTRCTKRTIKDGLPAFLTNLVKVSFSLDHRNGIQQEISKHIRLPLLTISLSSTRWSNE